MLDQIINQASHKLHAYFDRLETNRVAEETGFVIRKSKLDGYGFLKGVVLGFLQHPRASLNQLSQDFQDGGLCITPQGIDERLNQAAVDFLQNRLAQALLSLQAKRQAILSVLEQFDEVYLQDSTILSLPPALQADFAGSGGLASPAAMKIQLLFAFLQGKIAHLEMQPGRAADTGYEGHLPHLLPGSLLIQDLGYFTLRLLQSVVAASAFFLTRWRSDTQVFLEPVGGSALEMVSFLQRQSKPVTGYPVYLGFDARLSCRMVVVRLPEPVASQRRRRLIADAQRRGKPLSQRSLQLCDWNVFLTNVPAEKLSLHQILTCYCLRWQVELIFKLWKSQAALDHLGGLRRTRVLAELYAKLIGLVLTHFIVAPLRFFDQEVSWEISPPKVRQIVQNYAPKFSAILGTDEQQLATQMEGLMIRILHFGKKNHRRKKLSSYQRVRLANELTVEQLYLLA